MRFDLEQAVAAPLGVVEAAYLDPRFYEALDGAPGLSVTGTGQPEHDGDRTTIRVRFAYTGEVSRAVRAVVDPSHLTWVTVLTGRPGTHVVTFEIVPDHHRDLLHCRGGYRFAAAPGDATHQEVGGELSVRVPLMGRAAERAIVSGFAQHLEAAADVLATWA